MERITIMSNIRLIISDIDGTILTSNHQVDEQLIELFDGAGEKTLLAKFAKLTKL